MPKLSNEEVNEAATTLVQMLQNKWMKYDLPQDVIARSMVVHGAVLLVALIGPAQCAAELRMLADDIQLGGEQPRGSA